VRPELGAAKSAGELDRDVASHTDRHGNITHKLIDERQLQARAVHSEEGTHVLR
jgi:hypothetical protein